MKARLKVGLDFQGFLSIAWLLLTVGLMIYAVWHLSYVWVILFLLSLISLKSVHMDYVWDGEKNGGEQRNDRGIV